MHSITYFYGFSHKFLPNTNPFKELLSLKERCSACAWLIFLGASIACIGKSLSYVWKKYYKVETKKYLPNKISETSKIINTNALPLPPIITTETPVIKTQSHIRALEDSSQNVLVVPPPIDSTLFKPTDKEHDQLKAVDQLKAADQLLDSTKDLNKGNGQNLDVSYIDLRISFEKQPNLLNRAQLTFLLKEAFVELEEPLNQKDHMFLCMILEYIKKSNTKIDNVLGRECIAFLFSIYDYNNLFILFEYQPDLFHLMALNRLFVEAALEKNKRMINKILDHTKKLEFFVSFDISMNSVNVLLSNGDFETLQILYANHPLSFSGSQIILLLEDSIIKKDTQWISQIFDKIKQLKVITDPFFDKKYFTSLLSNFDFQIPEIEFIDQASSFDSDSITQLLNIALVRKNSFLSDKIFDYIKNTNIQLSSGTSCQACIRELYDAKDYKNLQILFDAQSINNFSYKCIIALLKNAIATNDKLRIDRILKPIIIDDIFLRLFLYKDFQTILYLFNYCPNRFSQINLKTFLSLSLNDSVLSDRIKAFIR